MKPIVIIAIVFGLLISSITPYVNAEPLQIIQECTNNVITLKISDSEGPVENVSVYIYREIGLREYEGKVVTDENGKAKITNTSRTNAAKVTKGGYNDTQIFLECLPPKTNVISEPTVQKIPDIPTHVPLEGIPDWVKNTVGWWSEGQLKDEEFVNSVGFLIKNGIITLPKTEFIEGVSSDMIFNLLPNDIFELIFDGGVIPVPVSPVFLELTNPDGTTSQKEQMIGAGGHYSFPLRFSDDAELGIYNVELFFNNKLIKTESFKLEKPVPTHTIIPDWIKNNAKWWANDKIDEGSFISGIQYLVNEKIIILETNDVGKSYEKNPPSSKYTQTHIDGFPNPAKSSKYYLDRYNNDFKYREWFNSQFPHKTMYDVLGIPMDDAMILDLVVPNHLSVKTLEVEKTENILLKNDDQITISTKYTDLQNNDSLELRIVKASSEDCALLGFQGFSMSAGFFGKCGFMLNVDNNGDLVSVLEYFPYFYLFSDGAFCVGFEDYFIQCVYDQFFFSVQLDKESIKNSDHSKILSIFLIEKIFDNIDTVNHNSFISKTDFDFSNWKEKSFDDVIQEYGVQMIRNEDVAVEGAVTQLENEGFSGLYCKQDRNWIEMTGRYTNGPDSFSSIYFTLGILDHNDRIVATGTGLVSNIGPYQTKMFEASTEWSGNFKECIIEVNTAYP